MICDEVGFCTSQNYGPETAKLIYLGPSRKLRMLTHGIGLGIVVKQFEEELFRDEQRNRFSQVKRVVCHLRFLRCTSIIQEKV